MFNTYTSKGNVYYSHTLISATGSFNNPNIPHVPGQEMFQGQLLHSKEYKSPNDFKKKRVIVVGAGNSAVQIAVELAQVANVTLAVRSSVKFLRQRFLNKDIHFWIQFFCVDRLPIGRWIRKPPPEPVLDSGGYEKAISQDQPSQRQMFTGFTKDGVIWDNDMTETVNTVIFATGYRHKTTYLKSIDALSSMDFPLQRNGISKTIEGLYFVGIHWQRSHASATLRGVGNDAKYVVKRLKKFLSHYY